MPLILLSALSVGGCATGGGMPEILSSAATQRLYSAPPTDVYARIARGALGCWLGRSGPLRGTHIFYADAESPTKGGGAEIAIHERDAASGNPRALRALRILIQPGDGGTLVAVEPLRITPELGARMTTDAYRWAGGGSGCGEVLADGWSPNATAPPVQGEARKGRPAKGKAKAAQVPR